MPDSSSLPAREFYEPKSIGCLVLFLLAAFLTIQPLSTPVPVPSSIHQVLYWLHLRDEKSPLARRSYRLQIDFRSGPFLAVLILLASTCIGISELRAGIKGVGDVHPYDILLLFFSLAYIAISLDATGGLRYLAFLVAQKGGTSGWKLYLYFYLFFIVLGGIVGNDPVILSGTAFLAYFTQACGIEQPTAWIFAEFMAANLTSMVFVSSNPTNLVVSSASQINFIYFTAWTIIPAIISSFTLYQLLMLQFFPDRIAADLVPRVLKTPEVHPQAELINPRGAIFKAVLLVGTLIALIVSNVLVRGLYVWWVTVPAALLAFTYDVVYDCQKMRTPRFNSRQRLRKDGSRPHVIVNDTHELQEVNVKPNQVVAGNSDSSANIVRDQPEHPTADPNEVPVDSARPKNHRWSMPRFLHVFRTRLPTVYNVAERLPWALLPFAFSFFILVDALSSSGWITLWAKWLSAVVGNNDVIAVFFVGFICILLCNISTNIGATLILVNIIYDPKFLSANPSPRVQYGALFAIAVCSNIGAYSFVFPASLAGLLWRGILKQKGIEVRALDFVRYNTLPLLVTATVALAVVVGEVRVIFPDG